jgi:hypothetical protein
LLEDDRYFHAERYLFNRAVDDIGDHARAFFEIDPGDDVGDVRRESLRRGAADDLADYGERLDLTLAAHRCPLDALAATLVAQRARGPNPCAAVVAMLHHELILRRCVPKGFRFGGDRRQRFSNVYFGHKDI